MKNLLKRVWIIYYNTQLALYGDCWEKDIYPDLII